MSVFDSNSSKRIQAAAMQITPYRSLLAVSAIILCGCHALNQPGTVDEVPQKSMQITPVSSTTINGIDLTGEPVGERFKARFRECDTSNRCDGERLRYGCSKDPNRNSVLLRLRNGTIAFDAKMGLDADGSVYSETTPGKVDQPETSLRYPMPGRPSIKSDHVPFIVVPLGGFESDLGVRVGDVAAVVYRDKRVFAIVGDQGPKCKIGEGSIKLHELLDHRVCLERSSKGDCTKIRDVGIENGVLYMIFPDTRERLYDGLRPENVNQRIEAVGKEAWRDLHSARP